MKAEGETHPLQKLQQPEFFLCVWVAIVLMIFIILRQKRFVWQAF
jgi:hypothetical protein